ncbi:hypothetical protein ACN6K9_006274, partial [Streptomyces sp. SAS_267]|uniref:hypothetical protein n=1 Tax=Streptomyces sp. SAS_267 TaxID=3412750 RepID=UPI00403D521D
MSRRSPRRRRHLNPAPPRSPHPHPHPNRRCSPSRYLQERGERGLRSRHGASSFTNLSTGPDDCACTVR